MIQQQLKALRLAAGFSQTELGLKLGNGGYNKQTVSAIENELEVLFSESTNPNNIFQNTNVEVGKKNGYVFVREYSNASNADKSWKRLDKYNEKMEKMGNLSFEESWSEIYPEIVSIIENAQ